MFATRPQIKGTFGAVASTHPIASAVGVKLPEAGHSALPRFCEAVAGLAGFLAGEWPTSAAVRLPGGRPPEPWSLFRDPDLAETWRRLTDEGEPPTGRETQIEAARRALAEGFAAETVDAWMREARMVDGTGARRRGVLEGADLAAWRASYEPLVAVDHHNRTVFKPGPRSQGPVLVQPLRLMEDIDDADSEAFVHPAVEALQLAMADREAHDGDPVHVEIPTETLLSRAHAAERRAPIGEEAPREQRPGQIPGLEPPGRRRDRARRPRVGGRKRRMPAADLGPPLARRHGPRRRGGPLGHRGLRRAVGLPAPVLPGGARPRDAARLAGADVLARPRPAHRPSGRAQCSSPLGPAAGRPGPPSARPAGTSRTDGSSRSG